MLVKNTEEYRSGEEERNLALPQKEVFSLYLLEEWCEVLLAII